MRSALSAKLADGELTVLEAKFDKPCTKEARKAFEALGIEGRVTLVVGSEDVNTYLSFRNLPKVLVIPATAINTYDFINNKNLVITTDALNYIQEVLA